MVHCCLGDFVGFFTLLADFILLLFGWKPKKNPVNQNPSKSLDLSGFRVFFSGQFTAEESTSRFASRFPSCVIFLPRNGTNSSSGKGAVWTLRDGAFRHPLPSIHPLEDPGYVICECMLLLTQEFFAKMLLELEVSFMTCSRRLKYDTVDGSEIPNIYLGCIQ